MAGRTGIYVFVDESTSSPIKQRLPLTCGDWNLNPWLPTWLVDAVWVKDIRSLTAKR